MVTVSVERPPTSPSPADGEARWVRPFVAVVAVVGLLLLGAAGGLLLGVPGSSTTAEPGTVDVGFSQDMSVHHLQGVDMASWERDHTTDPVLAQLATDIEKTQNNQVGQMQGWLALWDAPALPIGGYMAWMTGEHGHAGTGTGTADGPVATMPGMATAADLDALRAATGPELDVLFLQLMLRHHEGGAEMLRYAAESASVPQVRSLAAQMLGSQTSEAEYLRQLLLARGGTPLPL
ncbi:DUF305 domain-containing protein [Pseudonocardia broussonetiae]|uniref:DUF305 domain-containing protein n=1 Tax=Pseudonocardia broussonetiae TaxID=2736640 RepID=A0A6M6JT77_9PSEU|nr:DUF305 domain-containing protein [Pseudonocardia broussonetiae]